MATAAAACLQSLAVPADVSGGPVRAALDRGQPWLLPFSEPFLQLPRSPELWDSLSGIAFVPKLASLRFWSLGGSLWLLRLQGWGPSQVSWARSCWETAGGLPGPALQSGTRREAGSWGAHSQAVHTHTSGFCCEIAPSFNMLTCRLSVPGTGGVSSCSLGPGALPRSILWEHALEDGAWTLGLGGGHTDCPVQHVCASDASATNRTLTYGSQGPAQLLPLAQGVGNAPVCGVGDSCWLWPQEMGGGPLGLGEGAAICL